jgi:cytidylate kinase
MMASKVSAIPAVRTFLLSLQRKMAEENNVIMDGRDIGTVVLPNAQIKLFLTASVECRAQRRYEELIAKGMEVTLEDVQSDMEKRDYADSHRAVAPLKPAEDAQIVDTSWLELHQSVALLTEIITRRLNG